MRRPDSRSLDRIMISLRLKKPRGGLTREQALGAWPVRNPSLKWAENEEGEVVVELPRRQDWVGKILSTVFMVPDSRPISLDEPGTFVWGLCDGEHTVGEIAEELRQEYKMTAKEAEVSLTQYLHTLGRRGMVAFAVPREVADEAGIKGIELQAPEDVVEAEGQETAGETEEQPEGESEAP